MDLYGQIAAFSGGRKTTERALHALAEIQLDLLTSAEVLARDATSAPHPAGKSELTHLAGEDRALGEQLFSALADAGGPVPLIQRHSPAPQEADSYWKRLCAQLETHVRLRANLDRVTAGAPDLPGEAAATLHAGIRQEEDHVRRLRDLISRADPHGRD